MRLRFRGWHQVIRPEADCRRRKRDLAEQFQARARAADGDPPPVADLKAQISQLSDSSPPQPQHPR